MYGRQTWRSLQKASNAAHAKGLGSFRKYSTTLGHTGIRIVCFEVSAPLTMWLSPIVRTESKCTPIWSIRCLGCPSGSRSAIDMQDGSTA
eukprot:scaffold7976_cov403-Prasinococcus_capsulatus_cf.AAC.10